jgi:hypothetical protein
MAIAYRGAGTVLNSTGSTSFSFNEPTAGSTGDLWIASLSTKPFGGRNQNLTVSNTGYALIDSVLDTSQLANAINYDSGNMSTSAWWRKRGAAGTNSLTVTSDLVAYPSTTLITSFYSTVGAEILISSTTAVDNVMSSNDLTLTGQSIPYAKAGSMIVWLASSPTNLNPSSFSHSLPGCTLGTTVAVNGASANTNFYYLRHFVRYTPITAGTPTGAPSMTVLYGTSGYSSGSGVFLVLSEAVSVAVASSDLTVAGDLEGTATTTAAESITISGSASVGVEVTSTDIDLYTLLNGEIAIPLETTGTAIRSRPAPMTTSQLSLGSVTDGDPTALTAVTLSTNLVTTDTDLRMKTRAPLVLPPAPEPAAPGVIPASGALTLRALYGTVVDMETPTVEDGQPT